MRIITNKRGAINMQQATYEKTIGKQKFTFVLNAATHKEFFEQASFYSSLPEKGPNGEEDLQITFRTTKQGHTYYSIICPSAKKEYKFGQSQQKPGELFGKGWEDLYDPTTAQNGTSQEVNTAGGLGAPAQAQAVPTPAPQQGLGAPAAQAPVQQAAPTPTPAPAQTAQPAAAAPAANPQVQAQANDVLSKFLGN